MLKKYSLWDGVKDIITPSGKVYTADEWKVKYPIAALPGIEIVGSAGTINGGIFDTLNDMVERYESMGCDFSQCTTSLEKLQTIENFEEEQEREQEEAARREEEKAEKEYKEQLLNYQRIADALEDLVVLNMPDLIETEGEK